MVTRIGGLASGMDIDSLVEKLMSAERAPLYKLQQKKTTYEWQRDAYRSVNTKIDTFSKYLFDNFLLSSNFVKKSTTITGANSDKVSITAGTGASSSLNIQGVNSLASAATSGAKTVEQTTYRNAADTDRLVDLGVAEGTINLNIDGVPKVINIDSGTKVSDLVAEGFAYDKNTGRFSFGGKKVEVANEESAKFLRDQLGFKTSYTSSAIKIKDPDDVNKEILAKPSTKLGELGVSSLTFSIGGEAPKTVNLDPEKNIADLVTELKNEGLEASFDAKTGKLNISAKDGKTLQFDDGNQADLAKLGLLQTVGGFSKAFSQVEIDKYGGTPVTPSSSTSLQHLGLLSDGKFKVSAVQADGKMKDTIIEFKATDTVDSLIKRINSSGAGVTALFSNGQMSISANSTGTNKENVDADIQLKSVKTVNDDQSESIDNSGFKLFNKLGFISSLDANTQDEATFNLSNKGTNAKYKINDLEMESQTNTINIQGYSIKLTGTFNTDYSSTTQGVSVSASNDIDSMMTKIKEFVTTYNGLVTDLNNSLKENKYRDYAPLTSEQREGMSESEVKLWEEKARSGLLRNDSTLREGLSKMRSNFMGEIGGLNDSAIDSLSEIGITTSSKVTDGGTLVINETKLRAALEKDPDQVSKIFTQMGKAEDTVIDPVTGQSKNVDSRGIVKRLRDSIDNFKLQIEKKAGRSTMTDSQYNIGKSMIDLDKRIDRMQTRLVSVEQRYWKQFSAMESAINKANSQSSIFS